MRRFKRLGTYVAQMAVARAPISIRVLSAEGKLSDWNLSGLTFGAALTIQLVNPQFLEVLYTDPGGRKMIAGALGMMAMGVLAMRKIIGIRA